MANYQSLQIILAYLLILCIVCNYLNKFSLFIELNMRPYSSDFFSHTALLISNKSDNSLPLILAYTPFWHWSILYILPTNNFEKCPFKCRFSENNKSLYPYADAVIFHMVQFNMDKLLFSSFNSNRLNVFFSRESPALLTLPRRIPLNFFNVTLTYRRDSTIWRPYDKFEEISEAEKNDESLIWTEDKIEEVLKKKTKLAIKIVSNCKTPSKREIYIDELRKFANISLYGKCYNKVFAKDSRGALLTTETESIVADHYFYLAFENSVCRDYITEKFWRIKELVVPVVLKRSILKGIVDDKFFIAADDFASPKELVDRLIYLSNNHTEYRNYLTWTHNYKKTSNVFKFDEKEMCRICEMVTKKEKHYISNIYQWWRNQGLCESGYAEKLL